MLPVDHPNTDRLEQMLAMIFYFKLNIQTYRLTDKQKRLSEEFLLHIKLGFIILMLIPRGVDRVKIKYCVIVDHPGDLSCPPLIDDQILKLCFTTS